MSVIVMDFYVLAEKVRHALEDKKAQDLVVLNVEGICPITDVFVIASGTSTRHLKTLCEAVDEMCSRQGIKAKVYGREDSESQWIAIDIDTVIVHLLSPDMRTHYNLEELWSKGPIRRSMSSTSKSSPDNGSTG